MQHSVVQLYDLHVKSFVRYVPIRRRSSASLAAKFKLRVLSANLLHVAAIYVYTFNISTYQV